MPLSALTVPGLGAAVLRWPSPRRIYRRLLAQGLGPAEAAAAPDCLIEALRLSVRRPENARTVASLMHAINRFRRPRPESVLTTAELAAITTPTIFIIGSGDPYLSIERARPSIGQIHGERLYELPGGHAPWLPDPQHAAELIATPLIPQVDETCSHLEWRLNTVTGRFSRSHPGVEEGTGNRAPADSLAPQAAIFAAAPRASSPPVAV
jgi:pimeloyl-ACP methyl ester carboxylesterase